LDGKQNGHVRKFTSISPDKEVSPLKHGMNANNFNTAKKKVMKSLTELNLLLDLAERQEGWPLHSEASTLKEKLQDGQPAEIIKQLEERLEAARGTEVKKMKRASFAPSPGTTNKYLVYFDLYYSFTSSSRHSSMQIEASAIYSTFRI
jgi:hypothetical protein